MTQPLPNQEQGPSQSQSQSMGAQTPAAAGRLLRVTHDTHYRYAARVEGARHLARLTPLACMRQQLLEFELQVTPDPGAFMTAVDAFGNARTFFSLDLPHEELMVRSHSLVRVTPSARVTGSRGVMPAAIAEPGDWSMPWELVAGRLAYQAGQPYDAASEFVFDSPHIVTSDTLAQYGIVSFTPQRPLVQGAWDLMRRIHADFAYTPNSTDVNTSALDALALRKGVCQDFAHVMIGAMRSLGLAARYVSGYLLTEPPPGQPRLIGADASHAWVEVYDPAWPEDQGWLQLDPTNDRAPGDDYVMLAVGRDYADVAPLRGVIRGGGADQVLDVGVTVEPVGEEEPLAPDTPDA